MEMLSRVKLKREHQAGQVPVTELFFPFFHSESTLAICISVTSTHCETG